MDAETIGVGRQRVDQRRGLVVREQLLQARVECRRLRLLVGEVDSAR